MREARRPEQAVSETVTRLDLLELDIDTRMAYLWAEAENVTDWNLEAIAIYLRAAYGLGYVDALRERKRGQLCRDHGYRVPRPK